MSRFKVAAVGVIGVGPAGRRGRQPGRESQLAASPSWLTRLGDDAARRYNQIAPSEGASA